MEHLRRNGGHPATIKFSLRRCSTKYRRCNWRTSLPIRAISTILSACNHRSRSLLFSKDTMCTLYVYNDSRSKLGLLRTIGISFHSTDGKSIRPGNYDPRRRRRYRRHRCVCIKLPFSRVPIVCFTYVSSIVRRVAARQTRHCHRTKTLLVPLEAVNEIFRGPFHHSAVPCEQFSRQKRENIAC